jgi:hypothetical protein
MQTEQPKYQNIRLMYAYNYLKLLNYDFAYSHEARNTYAC